MIADSQSTATQPLLTPDDQTLAALWDATPEALRAALAPHLAVEAWDGEIL